ncbi:MAG: ATP-dependent Clp protease ATP-binding subunit [Prevotella sp.]|nr:ATP-dependent Clp protease ATP-binding subunit [Prevotella sp.]MBQ3361508.1 ATP-dependent Clp protease ATP-binding subunit [Prevotella sp.]
MNDKLKSIANSFAEEYRSDAIYPAHLFKAVLHKEIGLVHFIESELDKDYYYLQDWADVQMQLAPKSAKPMRDLEYSDESIAVLEEAETYQAKFGLDECTDVCVLASLVTPGVGFPFDQLKTLPLTPSDISAKMGAGTNVEAPYIETPTTGSGAHSSVTGKGALGKYCEDRTAAAKNGKIDHVVGFEDEIEIIYEILGRKTKANLLITGESGVGKSSLVNGFILELAAGKVPGFLADAVAYELDTAALGSDAQYKGEVEDRFKSVINEVEALPNAVLIIDKIDKLFDKQGSLFGASTLLKNELNKGRLQLICTSSIDGFTKNIETDKEMVSCLEKISIEEPDADHTLEILKGIMPEYEKYHGLTVSEAVMTDAIRLAKRYLTEKSLPASAIDLLDRTMATVKVANDMGGDKHTDLEIADLNTVVAKQTGIPLGKVETKERDRLMGAEETLKNRVVGQDHAVKKVLDAVYESRSGLNKKGQPMGSFFFLGPTGTGKTELSKALAEFLFGDESSLLRFDMSEFKEEHSVALLYGAPPGYVGYEEGGLLVNKIRQNPYSVVLFDEIEKAHKSVFDLFLQILDEGKLHDRLGRVGDFSNALILFTSNIGAQTIVEKFNSGIIPENNELMDIMQGYFRPEFLARLTEIVPFSPITEQTVTKIFDIHMKGLLKLLDEQNITLTLTPEARKAIALRGFNQQYGARPILGIIRKELRHPLSKKLIAGDIKSGDHVVVDIDKDGNVIFKVENK